MKTLIVMAIILGVLFLYFVAKAEKSFIIKGSDLIPGGIDIPKFIFDKLGGGINPQTLNNDVIGNVVGGSGQRLISDVVNNAKDIISKTIEKAGEAIKAPIENKIQEYICP